MKLLEVPIIIHISRQWSEDDGDAGSMFAFGFLKKYEALSYYRPDTCR